jgi:hypothetical protein
MTQKSSHLMKAIKKIYKHIDIYSKSQLEKDILETIIFHLTKIEEQSRGVNDAKQQK